MKRIRKNKLTIKEINQIKTEEIKTEKLETKKL